MLVSVNLIIQATQIQNQKMQHYKMINKSNDTVNLSSFGSNGQLTQSLTQSINTSIVFK